MKAWLLPSIGSIDNLSISDIPAPVPAAAEVIVDVHFAALNPADRYLAEGQYPARPTMPHILGRDAVGAISAVGSGVRDYKVGDRVMILRGDTGVSRAGTFAEQVAVPAADLVAVPAGWSEPQAAGATLVYLTAYQALTQFGQLPPSVVLITGASGGVGVASAQLAKAMGHTVIALSRSADKRGQLEKLGADETFDPEDAAWRNDLKTFLASRNPTAKPAPRVDLVIDNVGGTLFSQVIETLGMNGKASVVGRLAGPVPDFNTATLFFRRLMIRGVAVGTYANAESQAAWAEIVKLLAKGNFHPLVDSIHPFDQLQAAFAKLQKGPMGKVLLQVRG